MKFSARALNLLASHAWPGNIRELDNEIKRIVVCTRHTTITEEDLSEAIRRSDSGTGKPLLGSLKDKVADLERRMIREQLTKSQGNVQKAAKLLGLSRQGLIKKLKRYGMKARS
jgi:DNA-binding NtrC family response regulator